MLKLSILATILVINLSVCLSSPLVRVRRSGHGVPVMGSSSQRTSMKIKSGVDNHSTAETSIAEINLPVNVGAHVDTGLRLANGVLAGGVGGSPISKALDLPAIIAGLGTGIVSGNNGPARLPPSPKTVVIDEVLADIQKSNAPVAASSGLNLADIPTDVLGDLGSLVGNVLSGSS